jgi:hypothetical protein
VRNELLPLLPLWRLKTKPKKPEWEPGKMAVRVPIIKGP